MAPPLVRRRRSDGLVEIRPRRVRDLVASADAPALVALTASFLVFGVALVSLVALLLVSPILVGIAGGFVLLGAWGGVLARPLAPARSPSFEPPPRRAA
jgi:hypothetical protein